MTALSRPPVKPARPHFSSGPCVKRPGWTPKTLDTSLLGRSHRAKPGKARIAEAIALTHKLLELPKDYRVGIMPASDTGAFEAAMWSLLGARGVEVIAWESFGSGWANDIVKELGLGNAKVTEAPYGALPDLTKVDFSRDVIFTWNGTTSGVRVPDGKWIPGDRAGLTFADATSAAFAQAIDWPKIDVATFSFQKALGGEAQHGVLILSPRAVQRLESFMPKRPIPKIFRLAKGGALIQGIFEGETINTPSMLVIEDYLDALRWAEGIGGLEALIARANAQCRSDRSLGVDDALGQASGQRSQDTIEHVRVPRLQREGGTGGKAGRACQGDRRAARRRGGCLRHRRLSRCAAGLAHLVRLDGRGEPTWKR